MGKYGKHNLAIDLTMLMEIRRSHMGGMWVLKIGNDLAPNS